MTVTWRLLVVAFAMAVALFGIPYGWKFVYPHHDVYQLLVTPQGLIFYLMFLLSAWAAVAALLDLRSCNKVSDVKKIRALRIFMFVFSVASMIFGFALLWWVGKQA